MNIKLTLALGQSSERRLSKAEVFARHHRCRVLGYFFSLTVSAKWAEHFFQPWGPTLRNGTGIGFDCEYEVQQFCIKT